MYLGPMAWRHYVPTRRQHTLSKRFPAAEPPQPLHDGNVGIKKNISIEIDTKYESVPKSNSPCKRLVTEASPSIHANVPPRQQWRSRKTACAPKQLFWRDWMWLVRTRGKAERDWSGYVLTAHARLRFPLNRPRSATSTPILSVAVPACVALTPI